MHLDELGPDWMGDFLEIVWVEGSSHVDTVCSQKETFCLQVFRWFNNQAVGACGQRALGDQGEDTSWVL